MFDFLQIAAGIRVLYEHVKDELVHDDFWPLTPQQHQKLPPEDQKHQWFMINPNKLEPVLMNLPQNKHNSGNTNDIFAINALLFKILSQTTSPIQPSQSSFHNPALRLNRKFPSDL